MKITRKRVVTVVICLAILVVFSPVVYYFCFLTLVRVPTASMANTIVPGDHLVVKKLAFGEIHRGDVIVFDFPKNHSIRYVSRVIGLPRESIEVRGKYVYIDGKEIPERRVMIAPVLDRDVLLELSVEGAGPYSVFYVTGEQNDRLSAEGGGDFAVHGAYQIPDGEYFVMGDNRDNSEDSRYWGTVPGALIYGKPTMIYWSEGRDKTQRQVPRWERVFTKLKIY